MTNAKENIEDQLSDLLDDGAFREIDARFRRFNLFEAVGAVRSELRHSNFLAYLLSPGRPHALGSEILERFLRALLSKLPMPTAPSASSISLSATLTPQSLNASETI